MKRKIVFWLVLSVFVVVSLVVMKSVQPTNPYDRELALANIEALTLDEIVLTEGTCGYGKHFETYDISYCNFSLVSVGQLFVFYGCTGEFCCNDACRNTWYCGYIFEE